MITITIYKNWLNEPPFGIERGNRWSLESAGNWEVSHSDYILPDKYVVIDDDRGHYISVDCAIGEPQYPLAIVGEDIPRLIDIYDQGRHVVLVEVPEQ